jgi:hypothetical protein
MNPLGTFGVDQLPIYGLSSGGKSMLTEKEAYTKQKAEMNTVLSTGLISCESLGRCTEDKYTPVIIQDGTLNAGSAPLRSEGFKVIEGTNSIGYNTGVALICFGAFILGYRTVAYETGELTKGVAVGVLAAAASYSLISLGKRKCSPCFGDEIDSILYKGEIDKQRNIDQIIIKQTLVPLPTP